MSYLNLAVMPFFKNEIGVVDVIKSDSHGNEHIHGYFFSKFSDRLFGLFNIRLQISHIREYLSMTALLSLLRIIDVGSREKRKVELNQRPNSFDSLFIEKLSEQLYEHSFLLFEILSQRSSRLLKDLRSRQSVSNNPDFMWSNYLAELNEVLPVVEQPLICWRSLCFPSFTIEFIAFWGYGFDFSNVEVGNHGNYELGVFAHL